jgi:predicted acyltransferase (DUF342 family)
MTPPSNSNPNLELVLQAIGEVKAMLIGLDERVRTLEQTTITQSVTASQKLEAAFRKLDEHSFLLGSLRTDLDCRTSERVKVTDDLERRITRAEAVTSSVKWLGGILVTLAVALLWAVLTHQVDLSFK